MDFLGGEEIRVSCGDIEHKKEGKKENKSGDPKPSSSSSPLNHLHNHKKKHKLFPWHLLPTVVTNPH